MRNSLEILENWDQGIKWNEGVDLPFFRHKNYDWQHGHMNGNLGHHEVSRARDACFIHKHKGLVHPFKLLKQNSTNSNCYLSFKHFSEQMSKILKIPCLSGKPWCFIKGNLTWRRSTGWPLSESSPFSWYAGHGNVMMEHPSLGLSDGKKQLFNNPQWVCVVSMKKLLN